MPRPSAGLPSFWIAVTVLYLAAALSIGLSTGEDAAAGKEKNSTDEGESSVNATGKKNYTKTGIPQIDYVHDPNLPRELNGYNLSDYPFLDRPPVEIAFKCNKRRDGFYANKDYKCQVYHHCLNEIRADFLCPNYTAFDQSTFICHFVSEVDCENSELFHYRNDALYIARDTTTVAPIYPSFPPRGSRHRGQNGGRLPPIPVPKFSTTASPGGVAQPAAGPAAPAAAVDAGLADYAYEDYDDDYYQPRVPKLRPGGRPGRIRQKNRRRRLRPRPYYTDDYDDYEDDYDYRRSRRRKNQRRRPKYDYDDYDEEVPRKEKSAINKRTESRNKGDTEDEDPIPPSENRRPTGPNGRSRNKSVPADTEADKTSTTTTTEEPPFDPEALAMKRDALLTSSRPPPKIKPPRVPPKINNGGQGRLSRGEGLSSRSSTSKPIVDSVSEKVKNSQQAEPDAYVDSYYDDEVDRNPAPAIKTSKYIPFPSNNAQNLRKSTATTPTPRTTATTTSSTSTTTTTEQPYYEYYEYEEEIVDPKQIPTQATTTTTTTTPKPGRNKFRQQRRQEETFPSQLAFTSPDIQSDAPATQDIATSASIAPIVKHAKINEALETPSKNPSLRQPFLTRPRPSLPAFFSKNAPPTTTPAPVYTTSSQSASSEKYYDDYQTERSSQQSSSNEGLPLNSNSNSRATTPRSRNSRFRGPPAVTTRPTIATTTAATTTTTQAPVQDSSDYMYYEDSLPFTRYGQRSPPAYQQDSSGAEDYMIEGAQAPPPAPVSPIRSTTLRVNDRYNVAPAAPTQASSPSSTAGRSILNSRYNTGGGKSFDQSNLVTPYSPPSPPKTTPLTYLQFQEPKKKQQQQQHDNSQRNPPEYISLLPEDEEAYYSSPGTNSNHNHNLMPMMFPPSPPIDAQMSSSQQMPEQRFRGQITRMYPASQEYYPTYAPPPPPQNYVKIVRPRHVFPTMFFPPFGTYK